MKQFKIETPSGIWVIVWILLIGGCCTCNKLNDIRNELHTINSK